MEQIGLFMIAAFAVGLAIGLLILRLGRAKAVLEARQAAAQETAALQQDLKSWQRRADELASVVAQHEEQAAREREQLMTLSADVARATAVSEQVPSLRAESEDRLRAADGLRQELHAAKISLAEANRSLERVPMLADELARSRGETATVVQARDGERERAAALTGQLAKAEAALAAANRNLEANTAEVNRLRGHTESLQAEVKKLVEERTRLATDLDAERRAAAERAVEAERSKEQVRAEIEVLAARLLDEKGKAMLHQSREGLEALLKPVSEKLKDFEAKVEKTYDQENRDRASLLSSLQRLQETQSKLHEDAENLARALTGESKAQGDWGELVLERVLETAGLTEGREYDLQVNHVDEDGGRKRPDALVYLPGNRVIVVDAKCSLTAFVEAMRATTPMEREAALDAHVASVRSHVRGLAAKSYQDVVKEKTVDIVLLFVPNEAAFHEAIAREAGLYEEAFRQRVVICSPTTLLAALQLISHVWRSENQNVNAQKIAQEAGKLLDKLKAFVDDLDDVGTRIDQAQTSFQAAKNKLVSGRGNVMRKAGDILKLGARVKPETAELLVPDVGGADDDGALLLPEAATTHKAAGPSRSPVS